MINPEELTFVPAEARHFDEYLAFRSEPSNLFWLGYNDPPDRASFEQWYQKRLLEENRSIHFLINQGEIAGSLHIDFLQSEVGVGYSIREKYQKQGLATFMLKQGLNLILASSYWQLQQNCTIIAWISEANIGSQKVAESCGFVKSNVTEKRKRFENEETYHKFIYQVS